MFKRADPSPSREYVDKWTNGPVSIVVRAFLFGQYRVQIWYDTGGTYPDILSPDC